LADPAKRAPVPATDPPAARGGASYIATFKDRDTLVAGVKVLRRMAQAPALKRYIAEEFEPGLLCTSDDDLLDFIRRRGCTVYHPVSTCRMARTQRRWSTNSSRSAASSGCA
jgi:choline dehydrogenase